MRKSSTLIEAENNRRTEAPTQVCKKCTSAKGKREGFFVKRGPSANPGLILELVLYWFESRTCLIFHS